MDSRHPPRGRAQAGGRGACCFLMVLLPLSCILRASILLCDGSLMHGVGLPLHRLYLCEYTFDVPIEVPCIPLSGWHLSGFLSCRASALVSHYCIVHCCYVDGVSLGCSRAGGSRASRRYLDCCLPTRPQHTPFENLICWCRRASRVPVMPRHATLPPDTPLVQLDTSCRES